MPSEMPRRGSLADALIAASLAVLPLLPTGFTYLHRRWPWALEVCFLTMAAAALAYVGVRALVHRSNRAVEPALESTRLVSRGYATWVIVVLAGMVIGVLERSPFDRVILSIQANGLLNRLFIQPMHQIADPYYPVRIALTCIEGALAFWVLSAILRRTTEPGRRVRAAMLGAAIGVSLASLVAIGQYVTDSYLMDHWARMNPGLMRANGTLDDPNALASFLVLSIGLCAGVAWSAGQARPHWRNAMAVAATLGSLALATTVSRAGWLALAIAGVGVLALMPRRLTADQPRIRTLNAVARGGFVAIGIALAVWGAARLVLPKHAPRELPKTPVQALLQTIDPSMPFDAVLKGRLKLWQAAVDFGSEHWTLGAGLGQFPRLYGSYPTADGPENTHNYFLQTFAECGTVGLAGLAVLLVSIGLALSDRAARRTTAATRIALGLSIGALSFVLTWLTGHPMLTLSNQLWLGCMLAVGLRAIGSDDAAEAGLWVQGKVR